MVVKILFEVWELSCAKRIPLLPSAECPFYVGAVKLERESEWGKYIPPESGCSRHGITVSKSARREHAARRPIGALRRRTIRDHPKECDDPFVGLGVRHLIFPEQTGRWRPVQRSSAYFF